MDIVGLDKTQVALIPYQERWKTIYAEEERWLWKRLRGVATDIQHVGSTAVPGLCAKPIVDIGIAVRGDGAIQRVVERLVADGYVDGGDAGRDGGYLLVRESAPGVRTIHAHVVDEADEQWKYYLGFRDMLRRSAAMRTRYEALKKDMAEKHAKDRKAYTASKNDFIQSMLRELDRNDGDFRG